MSKLLTIGITTYNNMPFVLELIHTIDQNVSWEKTLLDEIDFILIDDCSDIEMKRKIDGFPSYIQKIYLSKNHGTPSVGRNLIISKIKTKYVLFFDGDDNLLAPLSQIVNELKKKESDIILSDVQKIGTDGKITKSPIIYSEKLFENRKITRTEKYKYGVHQTGIWNIYKVAFLHQHKLKYSETSRYEDVLLHADIMLLNPQIGILKTKYYGWRNNFESFSYRIDNDKHRLACYSGVLGKIKKNDGNEVSRWIYYSIWNQTYLNIIRDYPSISLNKCLEYYGKLEKASKEQQVNKMFFISQLNGKYVDKYTCFVKTLRIHTRIQLLIARYLMKLKKVTPKIKMNIFFNVLRLLPLQNKIFITSHYGEFNDNSKYLYLEEIEKQKSQSKIIFAVNGAKELNERYRTNDFVEYKNKLIYFYHHYTSRTIFFNSWYNPIIRKRRGQEWHQLWHGIPYKKVYKDINTYYQTTNPVDIKRKEASIGNWDYVYSVNEYNTIIFNKLFPGKKIIEEEYKKTKWLVKNKENKKLIEKMKKKYSLKENKKIFLYAPTYRPYEINIDLKEVYEILQSDNAVLCIHAHPLMRVNWENKEDIDAIFLEDIDDIQEIILCSDTVITDYSSIAYDFIKSGKEVIKYQPDKELYENIHGLYNKIEEIKK